MCDEKLIREIATLARLELSDKEVKCFAPQLAGVLAVFEKLKNVKTTNVKPSYHPFEIASALREDLEHNCLSQEEALSLTLHKKDGFFKGPKVL